MIRFADPRIVALSREDAFALRNGSGQSLDVLDGEIWLTIEGDTHDYVLSAGQRFEIRDPGVVVVTPLTGNAVLMRNGAGNTVTERRTEVREAVTV